MTFSDPQVNHFFKKVVVTFIYKAFLFKSNFKVTNRKKAINEANFINYETKILNFLVHLHEHDYDLTPHEHAAALKKPYLSHDMFFNILKESLRSDWPSQGQCRSGRGGLVYRLAWVG